MPVTSLCFWCQEFDRMPEAESLYSQCRRCLDRMKPGPGRVVLVEATMLPVTAGQVPLHLGGGGIVFPTGAWAIAGLAWLKGQLVDPGRAFSQGWDRGVVFLEPEVWEAMGLPVTDQAPGATTAGAEVST